jgi:hypothetical protein
VSFRTHLSFAGFGLAAVYAAVGVFELAFVHDAETALVFGISAAVTAGLVAVLLPLLAPRGGGEDGPDDGGGGGGPGGPDDGPPVPPWWPEFEREFWRHVDRGPARRGLGPRERTPA